jgi:L-tartrate/succinate antiporter
MSKWLKRLAPLAVAVLLATTAPPHDLPQHAWYYFALFIGTVLALIVEPLPAPAIGLIGITVIAASAPWTLFGPTELSEREFNSPIRAIEWALSRFNNSTGWLAFSAFMFGTAYDRTGLGRRIALFLVKKMGSRTLFLGYAVMLSDVVVAPFTPSNTARRDDLANHPQHPRALRFTAERTLCPDHWRIHPVDRLCHQLHN